MGAPPHREGVGVSPRSPGGGKGAIPPTERPRSRIRPHRPPVVSELAWMPCVSGPPALIPPELRRSGVPRD